MRDACQVTGKKDADAVKILEAPEDENSKKGDH